MQYKTIVLQLLEQRPQSYEQLRENKSLLAVMEVHARELKSRHEVWKEILRQAKPQSQPTQIASEALELALAELEKDLPTASPLDDHEPLSLDEAMAFIRRRAPAD